MADRKPTTYPDTLTYKGHHLVRLRITDHVNPADGATYNFFLLWVIPTYEHTSVYSEVLKAHRGTITFDDLINKLRVLGYDPIYAGEWRVMGDLTHRMKIPHYQKVLG